VIELILAFIFVVAILWLGTYIIKKIGLYAMFQKAGIDGALAFIPFYSSYLYTTKIARRHWLYFIGEVFPSLLSGIVFALLPRPHENSPMVYDTIFSTVAVVVSMIPLGLRAVVSYDTSKNYGKGFVHAVGLCFLPFIFTLILGFGGAKFNPTKNFNFRSKFFGPSEKEDDYIKI